MNDENSIDHADEPPIGTSAEIGRLQAENAGLKAAVRIASARDTVTDALRAAGARSPGLLFDIAMPDLQFSENDEVVNAAALLAELKAKFPEQFGPDRTPASIDGGAGRVAAPALTREALAKMSAAEIARLDWASVRNVLANG